MQSGYIAWRAGRGLLLAAVLLTGCQGERNIAKVSGRVTLDGEPVAEVLVHFQPELAAAAQHKATDAIDSSGITNAQGQYELRLADGSHTPGALVGKHIVRVSDRRATSDEDAGPSKAPPARFPARYSDGTQTFEVPAQGTDQANFELKSK
jgi:hypothetical protein